MQTFWVLPRWFLMYLRFLKYYYQEQPILEALRLELECVVTVKDVYAKVYNSLSLLFLIESRSFFVRTVFFVSFEAQAAYVLKTFSRFQPRISRLIVSHGQNLTAQSRVDKS